MNVQTLSQPFLIGETGQVMAVKLGCEGLPSLFHVDCFQLFVWLISINQHDEVGLQTLKMALGFFQSCPDRFKHL